MQEVGGSNPLTQNFSLLNKRFLNREFINFTSLSPFKGALVALNLHFGRLSKPCQRPKGGPVKDPLIPLDLKKTSESAPPPCFQELVTVKEMLSKLENAKGAHRQDLEISRNQLNQMKLNLGELTDQMNEFYQTFNAMKSWGSRLFNSYDHLLIQRVTKSQK